MEKRAILQKTGAIAAGGGIITTASVGGYQLLSNSLNSQEESGNKRVEDESPNPVSQDAKPKNEIQLLPRKQDRDSNSSDLDNGRKIMSQLNSLKSEKASLLSQIEDKITSYKNVIKDITNVQKLEAELNQCASKGEIEINISGEEKEELKKNYNQVKKDIGEYEKFQTNLTTGEVGQSETYADANNTDETRYNSFNEKLTKVKQEYQTLSEKESRVAFYNSFIKIKDKLKTSEQNCSFKDLIKINDELGQRNGNQ